MTLSRQQHTGRMALAEQHGAVLKLMIMKIVKEKTVMGLEEMSAVTCDRCGITQSVGFYPHAFGRENPMPCTTSRTRWLDIKKAAEEAFG